MIQKNAPSVSAFFVSWFRNFHYLMKTTKCISVSMLTLSEHNFSLRIPIQSGSNTIMAPKKRLLHSHVRYTFIITFLARLEWCGYIFLNNCLVLLCTSGMGNGIMLFNNSLNVPIW